MKTNPTSASTEAYSCSCTGGADPETGGADLETGGFVTVGCGGEGGGTRGRSWMFVTCGSVCVETASGRKPKKYYKANISLEGSYLNTVNCMSRYEDMK